ncbi:uncharacterized protein MYCGRDRAFT_81517 [Zymoseptoria tritici IPO323]|uniref:Uncharacterized protein n=1 Tax=Zymoseptoria tritici (strain CBS 115943 / IPO323) TaxID=336722 RepID=F9XFD4_ZYMTI|nr:uncharacterized protein MYCGRDRAFT_81517 [Zymoseptoria tritici IPO323]EGP86182.1 hypothetical protein MYCGRDRAFT_81517 [Zymoseptoria tritici IPO323]
MTEILGVQGLTLELIRGEAGPKREIWLHVPQPPGACTQRNGCGSTRQESHQKYEQYKREPGETESGLLRERVDLVFCILD